MKPRKKPLVVIVYLTPTAEIAYHFSPFPIIGKVKCEIVDADGTVHAPDQIASFDPETGATLAVVVTTTPEERADHWQYPVTAVWRRVEDE